MTILESLSLSELGLKDNLQNPSRLLLQITSTVFIGNIASQMIDLCYRLSTIYLKGRRMDEIRRLRPSSLHCSSVVFKNSLSSQIFDQFTCWFSVCNIFDIWYLMAKIVKIVNIFNFVHSQHSSGCLEAWQLLFLPLSFARHLVLSTRSSVHSGFLEVLHLCLISSSAKLWQLMQTFLFGFDSSQFHLLK